MIIVSHYINADLFYFDIINEKNILEKIINDDFVFEKETEKSIIKYINYDSYEFGSEEIIYHVLKENVDLIDYIIEMFYFDLNKIIENVDYDIRNKIIEKKPELFI